MKDCPRCLGSMIASQDVYGVFNQCLQCGHLQDLGKRRGTASKSLIGGTEREVA